MKLVNVMNIFFFSEERRDFITKNKIKKVDKESTDKEKDPVKSWRLTRNKP